MESAKAKAASLHSVAATAVEGGKLLFVGNKEWGPMRRRCYGDLRNLLGRGQVSHTYKAWSEAAFARKVLSSNVFVNLHKVRILKAHQCTPFKPSSTLSVALAPTLPKH